ncbi:MAG: glycosyltransferase, partial [Solobacterium sp.]|nr:glycosyltransferase [Solobacterium sp.]
MKTISVIVPVYNGEKYIDNCLNSILKQTLEDIEVICVNDGSTDSSSEILHRFAKADDRIKVIDKKNQGAGAARNDGIRSSEAKYIAFMDADDLYPGNSVLKTLYETAENNNADICGGYICSNGNLDGDAFRKFSREGFFPVKEEQIDYGFSRFIYKRACLLENNVFFPERSVFEDPVFLVKALHAAGKYYAVNECTYIYT